MGSSGKPYAWNGKRVRWHLKADAAVRADTRKNDGTPRDETLSLEQRDSERSAHRAHLLERLDGLYPLGYT
jgi:hypothetical protein